MPAQPFETDGPSNCPYRGAREAAQRALRGLEGCTTPPPPVDRCELGAPTSAAAARAAARKALRPLPRAFLAVAQPAMPTGQDDVAAARRAMLHGAGSRIPLAHLPPLPDLQLCYAPSSASPSSSSPSEEGRGTPEERAILASTYQLPGPQGARRVEQVLDDALRQFPRSALLWERLLQLHTGDMQQAMATYCQMQRRGIDCGLKVFVAILRGYLRHDRLACAAVFIDRMRADGYEPTAYLFNRLLHGFCQASRPQLGRARGLFDLMKDKGVAPDDASWTLLIHGYSKQGDLTAATRLFMQMRRDAVPPKRGPPPNAKTYSALLSGFYRTSRCREGVALFDPDEVPIDAYPMLAELYRKVGDGRRAIALCDRCLGAPHAQIATHHYAWCMKLTCLLHSDREAFIRMQQDPPFDEFHGRNSARLACLRIFAGLPVPPEKLGAVRNVLRSALSRPANPATRSDAERAWLQLTAMQSLGDAAPGGCQAPGDLPRVDCPGGPMA